MHLKDVRIDLVPPDADRSTSIMAGQSRPASSHHSGEGDLALAGRGSHPRAAPGYQGWYVIEQDTAITGGPSRRRARARSLRCSTSMRYLRDVVAPALEHDA